MKNEESLEEKLRKNGIEVTASRMVKTENPDGSCSFHLVEEDPKILKQKEICQHDK